jgi:putative ATPase
MSNTPIPLSARMRPQHLMDVVGQQHLVQVGAPLQIMATQKTLHSLIFWGPPGVGKTTLARILAAQSGLPFYQLSAIDSNVKEVRAVIEQAKQTGKVVLFLDEIHRFNKAQQDSLLGAVENGTIILIGASTENPSFEVINALLSRCQVYVLNAVSNDDLITLLNNCITRDEVLRQYKFDIKETDALLQFAGGDARKFLNIIELLVQNVQEKTVLVNNEIVGKILQQNILMFDKGGELHYDIISAFIKSMRGSDPNAAVYWLARMIATGEDPTFIARRMIIFASEDVGNANPNALMLANQCYDAVHKIGYPECRIILSQTAIYLATSAKSNATYLAINDALALVKKTGNLTVPLHLRNAPTQLMKQLNYGNGYIYPHNEPGRFVDAEYLPEEISKTTLYKPAESAAEQRVLEHLRVWWQHKYDY